MPNTRQLVRGLKSRLDAEEAFFGTQIDDGTPDPGVLSIAKDTSHSCTERNMRDIHTLDALIRLLSDEVSLEGVVVQNLDLRAHEESLLSHDINGAAFLGCDLSVGATSQAIAAGALVFPPIEGLPYEPYRPRLYTRAELFAGYDPGRPEAYADCVDGAIYAHWKATGRHQPTSALEMLARRLHDRSITDAINDFLADEAHKKCVAIMGGHGLLRSNPMFAEVARLAQRLTRAGFLVVTGGGPGAMEAGHLGAYLVDEDEGAVDEAVALLAPQPRYDDPGWLPCAFDVLKRFPPDAERDARSPSLGIPTWLYGHEPPSPFATHVGKYFANSVREEGLVTIAKHGIVFSPGSAGTIQEIFQDACQNHYGSVGLISPMVFLGEAYWTWKKPVFPLLAQLAAGRQYARHLHITDSIDAVMTIVERFDAELVARELNPCG